MKKIFAVLIAATVLGAPLAQAQGFDRHQQSQRYEMQQKRPQPPRHEMQYKRPQPIKRFWARGDRLPANVGRNVVGPRDFRKFRLDMPRRGEQWVRVGNQFLLLRGNGLIVLTR